MTTDPLDQPEPEPSWGLVVPFIACTSQGGPYDDASFVAGFEAGSIDRCLHVLQAAEGNRAAFTVRTAMVPQLELIAMNRGFPVMTAVEAPDTPEWSFIVFATAPDEPTAGATP